MAFLGTCSAATTGIFKLREARVTESVSFPPPDHFPVVVVTEEDGLVRATALYHREVDDFLEAHPGASFLIPEGEEGRLNADLRLASRARSDDPYGDRERQWWAAFEVLSREGGEQFIRAERVHDDDRENVGWYRATAEGYYPRRHRSYFGPGLALASGMMAIPLTAVLFLVVGLLRARRRRRRPYPPAQTPT